VIKTSEMTASAPHRPRIIIVTSETHYWFKFTPEELASSSILEKLNDAEHCRSTPTMSSRYYISKCTYFYAYNLSAEIITGCVAVINVLFTRELASRISHESAIVNCVNPGMCHSSLGRNIWKTLGLFQAMTVGVWYNLTARATEAGGRQLVWAATGGRHREQQLHGRYISDMEVKEESDFAVSVEGYETQQKLWVS
jgi:retinol dehydrogenase-12